MHSRSKGIPVHQNQIRGGDVAYRLKNLTRSARARHVWPRCFVFGNHKESAYIANFFGLKGDMYFGMCERISYFANVVQIGKNFWTNNIKRKRDPAFVRKCPYRGVDPEKSFALLVSDMKETFYCLLKRRLHIRCEQNCCATIAPILEHLAK